jgi:glc operon protein GlcG
MSLVKRMLSLIALAVFAALSITANAQLADKKVLTLEAAKKIAAAAEGEARKNNWNVVIAVVDDGGHLIYLQRIDGTQTGSIDVAIGKARTAAAFKRPTKVFDELAKTRPSITSISPTAVLLEGGIPVVAGGQVVGAFCVSVVTSQNDAKVGDAGMAAVGM